MLTDGRGLPSVIICGAPRCGTTSLYAYLGDHPDVCISKIKETQFFLGRDHPLRRDIHCDNSDLDAYAAYFEHGSRDAIRVGDEPYNLYSERAMEKVLDLPTDPVPVFIFRDPVDRLLSFFNYSQSNRLELPPDYDFDRYAAQLLDSSFSETWGARYPLEAAALEQGRYVDYLEPLWARLRGRAIIVLSNDLWRDPRAFMERLSLRIGLDPGFYADHGFPVKNESVVVRSRRLHALVSRGQRLVRPGTDPFTARWPGRSKLVKLYKMFNYRQSEKPSMSSETRKRLNGYYAHANQRLFNLIGAAPASGWAT